MESNSSSFTFLTHVVTDWLTLGRGMKWKSTSTNHNKSIQDKLVIAD